MKKEDSFSRWFKKIQNMNNPAFKMWRMRNRLEMRGNIYQQRKLRLCQ